MNSRLLCRLIPLALVSGCASPERIILLPEDGASSAVVVRSKGGELVLSEPYAVATVTARQIEAGSTDAASVQARYRAVMEALPARPRSFTLNFDFGKAQLTRESRALLDEVLQELKNLPAPELIIIGHADEIGTDAINDKLSLDRANSVLSVIKTKGVQFRDISVVGRGKREPLVHRQNGIPEARNRRVEIRIK